MFLQRGFYYYTTTHVLYSARNFHNSEYDVSTFQDKREWEREKVRTRPPPRSLHSSIGLFFRVPLCTYAPLSLSLYSPSLPYCSFRRSSHVLPLCWLVFRSSSCVIFWTPTDILQSLRRGRIPRGTIMFRTFCSLYEVMLAYFKYVESVIFSYSMLR